MHYFVAVELLNGRSF